MTTIQVVLIIFGIGSLVNAAWTPTAFRKAREARLDPYNKLGNTDMFCGWCLGIYISTIIVGIFCALEYFELGG
jgi:hypothetical protein